MLVTKPLLPTWMDEGFPFEWTAPPVATIGPAQTLFLLTGSVTVTAAEFSQICLNWLVTLKKMGMVGVLRM